ncbi:unnamed protein product [Pieris macdunnoughi]|uniref:Secreted protein n=1 Tax=Pieris macdunnoughi TaxID=345717 RepID=A0A821SZ09_9NEOP|nr:unnamed protein product [Pieris macdunnoughi]
MVWWRGARFALSLAVGTATLNTGGGERHRASTLTLQLFLRLPELLQFGEVLVEDEHLGEAERGHGGRRARITLSGRAALFVRVHSATTRAHRLSPTKALSHPQPPPWTLLRHHVTLK